MNKNSFHLGKNAQIRSLFPVLNQKVNDETLIYFDNAATTQKPQTVIDRLMNYYQEDNANIHRGVHSLAQRSTEQYEAARQKISDFIASRDTSQIIFTSGTTASINFLARGLVEPILQAGDQVMVTALEHHSNLVPWQEVCHRTGASLVYGPLEKATGQLDLSVLRESDTSAVKVIAIQHISNVLGIEQDIKSICEWAHQQGILVLVDGAQAAAHIPIDVEDLGIDAYSFSGHKVFAPTGIGVCYLKAEYHDQTQPVLFGGEMIHHVGDFGSDYTAAPWKFEAGTPPIAQAIALAEAIEFIETIGIDKIAEHERDLSKVLVNGLQAMEGIELYHPAGQSEFHGIVSFNISNVHPHDAATAFDLEGIAVRAGHHCAQVLHRYLEVPATLRASLSLYNNQEEVKAFLESTQNIKEFFTHGIR